MVQSRGEMGGMRVCARTLRAPVLGLTIWMLPAAALAQASGSADLLGRIVPENLRAGLSLDLVMFVLFTGAFAFAMGTATWLILEKGRLAGEHGAQAQELADLRASLARSQALVDLPDQRIVLWPPRAVAGETIASQMPLCRGNLPDHAGAPTDPNAFIAFGTWLEPQSAQEFEHAVERLRARAEAFDMTVRSRNGALLDAQGRTSGSHAFVRFLDLAGERSALASLEVEHTRLAQTADTLRTLLEALPSPVWLRDTEGRVDWANAAYLRALEAETVEETKSKGRLLDEAHGEAVDKALSAVEAADAVDGTRTSGVFRGRMPVTIAGDRRQMDVTAVRYDGAQALMAQDASEVETVQADLRRLIESNRHTMDQMASAIASFGPDRALTFHNRAFELLWSFPPGALADRPDNGRLLDGLRERGKVAEQQDWPRWRDAWLALYSADVPREDWWHLPDGRTLRVVVTPQKQGGVTWVFENITEKLEMETRLTALSKVQGETLDHMSEALAVFSPNGRLRLSNPAFQRMWRLSDEQVAADTKITAVADLAAPKICAKRTGTAGKELWSDFAARISGVSEHRDQVSGRMHLLPGKNSGEVEPTIHDYALVPLPNGQTLLSFVDVTSSVRMADMLVERTETLEAAERLKNAFIEHVSYEFRAPLTNIKGFSEVLALGTFGELKPKQAEYVDHIASSSNVLTSLVDNLLDLGIVDAGHMKLEKEWVSLDAATRNAAAGVADSLAERGVNLEVRLDRDDARQAQAKFMADPTRVQQVLFNVLGNAIRFSDEGANVVLNAAMEGDHAVFSVQDAGTPLPKGEHAAVFERFESRATVAGTRGAGLGLAIARSLTVLHGGTLEIDGDYEDGARFICRFPREEAEISSIKAAE
ncbi:ATP-binding protein [Rhizobiaceae bacterium]|nr:ATP-binding protein [Rhizobiaceae bacterium]